MAKKVFYAFTLFLLAWFLASCAMLGPSPGREEPTVPTYVTIQAKRFPAVLLKDKGGISKIVKILRLEGEKVVVLPSPYWNVQSEVIDLEQISSIKLTDANKDDWAWILGGALLGFYIEAPNGLSKSKYNRDYERALGDCFMAALSFGLLGWALERISVPPLRSNFNFSDTSREAKVSTLKKIMGAN